MIFLNILPEDLKNEIKHFRMYETIKKMVASLVVLVLFFVAVLLYSKFILDDNLKIRKTSYVSGTTTGNSTQKIQNISSRADKILKVQESFYIYSNIVYDIMQKSGDDILFDNLNIDTKLSKISMSGISKTRDDLLNFKNAMSSSPNYSNIIFPIENLLIKENIIFDISADIKSYDY